MGSCISLVQPITHHLKWSTNSTNSYRPPSRASTVEGSACCWEISTPEWVPIMNLDHLVYRSLWNWQHEWILTTSYWALYPSWSEYQQLLFSDQTACSRRSPGGTHVPVAGINWTRSSQSAVILRTCSLHLRMRVRTATPTVHLSVARSGFIQRRFTVPGLPQKY